jgi:TRAP-type transport system periplasmic protein
MRSFAWVTLVLGLVAQGASAQEFKFNLGCVLAPDHPVVVGLRRMAEVAEKQSGGRLKLEVFPSSQLGQQREMWQNTQAGLIGGIVEPTAQMANYVKEFGVLDLPYLVQNLDQAFKLVDGPVVEKELTSKAPAAGFRILHYWEITFRHAYTRTPVNSIADLKGKKIRVIPNPTFIALFRGMGAAPTPMAFGELYSAIQQGVVDGAENDAVTYFTSRHYEVARNYALTNHLMLINTMFFSEKQYQRLPEDLRKVLVSASAEGRKLTVADRQAKEEKVFDDLRKAGANITKPDLKPFVETGRKTWTEAEGRLGKDLIQKITKAAGH